jgi:hypothetical protein
MVDGVTSVVETTLDTVTTEVVGTTVHGVDGGDWLGDRGTEAINEQEERDQVRAAHRVCVCVCVCVCARACVLAVIGYWLEVVCVCRRLRRRSGTATPVALHCLLSHPLTHVRGALVCNCVWLCVCVCVCDCVRVWGSCLWLWRTTHMPSSHLTQPRTYQRIACFPPTACCCAAPLPL